MAAVVHAHVPGVVVAAVAMTQGLWRGKGEGWECRVGRCGGPRCSDMGGNIEESLKCAERSAHATTQC